MILGILSQNPRNVVRLNSLYAALFAAMDTPPWIDKTFIFSNAGSVDRRGTWPVMLPANGKRQPSLRQFGIDDIKLLARRIGGSAAHTHWLVLC
jgi:hypothetical protein